MISIERRNPGTFAAALYPIELICQGINKKMKPLLQGILYWTLGSLVKLYIGRIDNLTRIPAKGSFLVVSNQNSFIDALLLLYAVAKKRRMLISCMTRYDMPENLNLLERFVFRLITATYEYVVGSISTHREDAIDRAVEKLRGGMPVIIFPEGRHNRDNCLKKGKTGAARIALKSGAPILPVGIRGSEKIFPYGSYIPRFRKTIISIGEPLTVHAGFGSGESGEAIEGLTAGIMMAISGLCGKAYPYRCAHRKKMI
jgi:1-acyl-sn-glycerol-3-phosphate acyltransferase